MSYDDNKRILFILQNLEGGGAEKVFVNIANGFVEHGLEVDLLLGERKGVYFDLCDPRVNILDINTRSLIGYVTNLPKVLQKTNYSHVFTASDYITVAVRFLQVLLSYGFRHIGTLHYNLTNELNHLKWANKVWMRLLNKYIIASCDTLVSVSDGVANSFKKAINNQQLLVKTIYNPVFNDRLSEIINNEPNLIKNHHVLLIAVGRFVKEKDYPTLIQSIQILKERGINVELSIYGIGPLEIQLEDYVRHLGLDDRIFFRGFTKDIYNQINNADIFVLSSISEGLPTVLIEALALGTNVVATDCQSGPREILENGKFGFLAKVGDPVDLADKIIEAMKNPFPKEVLINHAQKFNEKNIIPQYLQLIKKIK